MLPLGSKHLDMKTYSQQRRSLRDISVHKVQAVSCLQYSTESPFPHGNRSFHSLRCLIPLVCKEGYECVAAPRHIFMFPLFTRCWQELNKKAIPPPLNSLRVIYLLISFRFVWRLSNGGEGKEWRDSFRWSGTLTPPLWEVDNWICFYRGCNIQMRVYSTAAKPQEHKRNPLTMYVQISPTKKKQ